jgi:hypothetical protein
MLANRKTFLRIFSYRLADLCFHRFLIRGIRGKKPIDNEIKMLVLYYIKVFLYMSLTVKVKNPFLFCFV